MSINRICDFVNSDEKAGWYRFALRKAIQHGRLTSEDLESAYSLARMQFNLESQSDDFEELTKKVESTGFDDETEEHRLVSIAQVKNVSTLAEQQILNFEPREHDLTVIYGNNGAGKSSYAKILKNACLTRGDIPHLKSNVFSTDSGVPAAEIEILSNGTHETINWNVQSSQHEKLKSIRVFDSSSAHHYLSKTDTLEFKLHELKLTDELLRASTFISEKAKEQEAIYSATPVLPSMHQGTSPSKFIITDKTTENDVSSLCATDQEVKELEDLRKEVIELSSSTSEAIRKRYSKRRLRLIPLQSFLSKLIEKLDDNSLSTLKKKFDYRESSSLASRKLRESTFSQLSVEHLGTEQWLVMWKAVKQFVSQSVNDAFPSESSRCPTCLQRIDADTAARLQSFDQYLQSELQKEAASALNKWSSALTEVKQLSFDTSPYLAVLNEIGEKDAELKSLFYELIRSLKTRADKLTDEKPSFEVSDLNLDSFNRLNNHIEILEQHEAAVKDDATRLKLIAGKNLRILELEDRVKIKSVKLQILKEVEKAKLKSKYSDLKRSAVTTPITRIANEISNESSAGRLQEHFSDELKKLGFNHFAVNALTRGSKGKQNFSMQLSDANSNIADIASEGEQKCISLAAFFAELTTDSRKSAIIFDDPVNSLDHVWRLKFATRIVEESKSRQVIVFTHDLPFLKMLQESTDNIAIKAVTRSRTHTGITLNAPPWDAMKTKSRIGALKQHLVLAKKSAETSHDDYKYQASIMYSRMRETWERLIEEWLIRGVVERFNREIKTQSCRYLTDISELDIETIDSAMRKCSTYMFGHDMSLEASGAFPSCEEIEQDLKDLDEYFNNLKARRTK